MTPCPWCAAPFEPAVVGGHAKRFCSTPCKHAAESAERKLGRMFAEGLPPGALRDWMAAVASRATAGCPIQGQGGGR